jgi:hypothetical protein
MDAAERHQLHLPIMALNESIAHHYGARVNS